ncbi:MAG: hypothetical protein ACXWUV_14165 [Allosphingosinicella sp.]
MTDASCDLAAESPLKPRRLLVTALIVAAISSLGASLILWVAMVLLTSGDSAAPSAGDVPEMIMGVLFIALISTIVAFPIVLAALLLLALPLTVLLVRHRVTPVARNLILLAVAAAAALLSAAPFYSPADPSSGYIFPLYAVAAGILWVLALHRLERGDATP